MITQQELKDALYYDHKTGVFVRKSTEKIAGTTNNRGYIQISVKSKLYLSHRLAWLYVYNKFPDNELDHINGIKTDNRICNLRQANRSENIQNQRSSQKRNKTRFLGTHFCNKRKKFIAKIMVNGKNKYLGCFNTVEDAYCAYVSAKRKLHPFGTI